MKRQYILGVLFFSGLWGISEALLGGALYGAGIRYASVPLTVIGLVILTFAKVYLPHKGTATLIAALAMLYKFLNAPFFGCHLLGILLAGICYDLFFNILRLNSKTLSSLTAVYLNYTLFALMITYIFRYEYWVQAGFSKIVSHIGIGGSIAALGCAVFVPVSWRLAERLKARYDIPFKLKLQPASGSFSALTTGLWLFVIAVFLLNI